MSSKEIQHYYEDTFARETRSDLIHACTLIETEKVAIDCGCGAGADIEYLREQGFIVHAFDIEKQAIEICRKRFEDDSHVHLSRDSFDSFNYPQASLIVADASLFFCPPSEFDSVWKKIGSSLCSDGIFCGSFLGPNDTMASPGFDREAYWGDILVFDENDLKQQFKQFEIIDFTEHNVERTTARGEDHKWHIYSVIARKI